MLGIKAMVAVGKTQREIAEHFGFQDKKVIHNALNRERKKVIHNALNRERKKEARLAAGIVPCKEGRPRKDAAPRDIVAEQAYEIK